LKPRPPVRLRSYLLVYGLLAAFLILAHGPLLQLPYYWDEIGQFIPASLDIFRAGAWIPISTVPNVHPPGVMAYLAAFWSLFGYSIIGTRIAMLLIAGLGGLVTFLLAIELSRGATGTPAFTALALVCISPLFFAQSMLAQLDMPAMCLSLLALLLYLQNRVRAAAITCALLVLVKETGLIVPAVLGIWSIADRRDREGLARTLWFLLPVPCLAIWLALLHHATGHWLGNSQFTRYNLFEPLHPVTFLLAFARRFYYLFIGTGHFIGTIALIWAYRRMPMLRDRPWRIAASFVLAQMIAVSALGGAVLERYLLPALPIVYIAFAAAFQALFPKMRAVAAGALLGCLAAANFVYPPYPFPFENNLAFTSFVGLEEEATDAVSMESLALPGGGRVATVFPVADALRNPDFGFVPRPLKVDTINDFSRSEVQTLRDKAPDLVVVYRREWDPLDLLDRPAVRDFFVRHYGYQPELSAEEVANVLSMRVARGWKRRGLSMYLLRREKRD
jgi:4-amino-4-deoxy-L-arabinose transferase-like glycosyltransferase